MSSTCFEHPSVHPQEELCMQFYGISFMHPIQAVWSMAGCANHILPSTRLTICRTGT